MPCLSPKASIPSHLPTLTDFDLHTMLRPQPCRGAVNMGLVGLDVADNLATLTAIGNDLIAIRIPKSIQRVIKRLVRRGCS